MSQPAQPESPDDHEPAPKRTVPGWVVSLLAVIGAATFAYSVYQQAQPWVNDGVSEPASHSCTTTVTDTYAVPNDTQNDNQGAANGSRDSERAVRDGLIITESEATTVCEPGRLLENPWLVLDLAALLLVLPALLRVLPAFEWEFFNFRVNNRGYATEAAPRTEAASIAEESRFEVGTNTLIASVERGSRMEVRLTSDSADGTGDASTPEPPVPAWRRRLRRLVDRR